MSGPGDGGSGNGHANGSAPGGSGGQGKRRSRRRKGGGGQAGYDGPDLWKRTPDLEPPELIVPVDESAATALLRSLGPPPLPGQGTEVLVDLSKVVVRASQLAEALAAAADLLDDDDHGDDDHTGDAPDEEDT